MNHELKNTKSTFINEVKQIIEEGRRKATYSEKNLRNNRQFYLSFKDLEIWNARVPNLTWTHS